MKEREKVSWPAVLENKAMAAPKLTLSASRDIPFNKLVLSQSNVRRIKTGVSIEELAGDCHIAVRRARSVGGSGIVRLLRLRSAMWSSPQREARGASGLK
jgi:hypothetical protein